MSDSLSLFSMEEAQPPLTLVLGRAGSGKTEYCLRRFLEVSGRAVFLVPTLPAERLWHCARRLGRAEDCRQATHTSSDFVRLICKGESVREPIRRSFQRIILAEQIETRLGAGDYFGKMRGVPGFITALGETIRELKMARISPDDLEARCGTQGENPIPLLSREEDPVFRRKLREIALLYRAYEQFLRSNNLYDEEDQVTLATRRIAGGAPLPREARAALVDGFYRCAPLWRALLAALAERGVEVTVTLPFDPARPLLFAASARTREQFRAEFDVTEIMLETPSDSVRPAELRAVERRIWRVRTDPQPAAEEPVEPQEEHLCLFDAPNPYAEVEMVARALRREHDRKGTLWSRCAIILRAAETYLPILTGVCEKYGIPLAVGQARIVADNPLIKTIMTLLNVSTRDWQREDVIAFLKSSYTTADKLRADALARRARKMGLRVGREGWRRLTEDLESREDPLAGILRAMLEADASLRSRRRSAVEFSEEIGLLIEQFQLEERSKHGPQAKEDLRALGQAKQVLADIGSACVMAGRGAMDFTDFLREAVAGWQSAHYFPPLGGDSVEDETEEAGQNGQAVAVLEPDEASRRDLDVAVVMGLTERVFPRRINEDPFFRDEERAALRGSGLELEPRAERADDERLLFYLAVTTPHRRLLLSYPRANDESDTLPSFYLDELNDALVFSEDEKRGAGWSRIPTVTRTLADVAPAVEECVTSRDRLLALAARLPMTSAETIPLEALASAAGLAGLTAEEIEALETVRASRLRPRLPRLEDEETRRRFTAPRRYRVTEIECYNRCPFQYLMQYGMEIRPETEGGGYAERGTLLHAVLRRCFRRRAETPSAASLKEDLLEELQRCLESHVTDAPAHRRQMMERGLREALCLVAEREERYRDIFGLTPAFFELAFGHLEPDGTDDEEIEPEALRDYDPASTPQPLAIPDTDGGTAAYLCGTIDRVDLAEDGRRALALDYKMGRSAEFTAIREGQSLQLPLYLLALEQLWGKIGAVGCYDSPRDTGRRRFFRVEEVDLRRFTVVQGVEKGDEVKPVTREQFSELMQTVQQRVRDAVRGIQAGETFPTPGECCRTCAYGDICRTSPDRVHDGEPLQ
jgi:ATP-dependent helicase/nuclease subunit B